MLFNSLEFVLIFLPITIILYFLLASRVSLKSAKYFLIVASMCFYSYWDVRNLPILCLSILGNSIFVHILSNKRSKAILILGVGFNLTLLCFFKYTNFILQNFSQLFAFEIPIYDIILPLGISFFTFTQTAYLVDVYRGDTQEYSKSDYLLFVTIFPHLIAGPILYHKDMIPQFAEKERYCVNYKNLFNGLSIFTIGLFKKVVIADTLAQYANIVYGATDKIHMNDAWLGSLAYTLQLYYDFSGYSEMAIGIGLMLNYNLPVNFNNPYRACSIIDFWRRWHITLSQFLKNYLYIPLGGNRTGHHMRNIMITMLLGGLWHGAGWTFVTWGGGIHGLCICINHLWRKTEITVPKVVSWLLTFNVVNLAWIFFRAESTEKAILIIRSMFDFSSFVLPYSKSLSKLSDSFMHQQSLLVLNDALNVLLCLILVFVGYRMKPKSKLGNYVQVVLIASILAFSILNISSTSEFLYFQF